METLEGIESDLKLLQVNLVNSQTTGKNFPLKLVKMQHPSQSVK